MRIKSLPSSFYKLYSYYRSQEVLEKYRKLYERRVKHYETLHGQGVDHTTIHQIVGISRATYYRHKRILRDLSNHILPPSKKPKTVRSRRWGEAEKQLVLKIRRAHPDYGREKIAVVLKRDHGQTMSESTIGRILTFLKDKKLITRAPTALRFKKKRRFNKHAKAWEFKLYKDMELGERIQIDHMSVPKNGINVKHFQAWERKSKYIHAAVYSNAKASSAKRFLLEYVEKAPFKIKSIQVDGGSEFMAEFEDTCKELNIPLIVLPPASPKYNGGVERANRTFREGFYNLPMLEDSVRGIQAELTKAVNTYNSYRPHKNLDNLTPIAYLKLNHQGDLNLSHM